MICPHIVTSHYSCNQRCNSKRIFCLLECLDVLITSLDQSPLEKYHIPALFFLAETMLYWLRTDAVHQPYLRTGEIKLLKVRPSFSEQQGL